LDFSDEFFAIKNTSIIGFDYSRSNIKYKCPILYGPIKGKCLKNKEIKIIEYQNKQIICFLRK